MQPPHEITQLLAKAHRSDSEALAELMPVVYSELRRIAGHYMRLERPDHTVQATALVNEATSGWREQTRRISRTARISSPPPRS